MKLGYIILYVADLEKTVAFYERAFGVERIFIHESGYAELSTGTTKLAFASLALAKSHVGVYHASAPEKPPLGLEIAFVTDTPEEGYAQAIAAGATEVAKPEKKPWGQVVSYVRDLNGFLVEICSPVG
jgi:lactoylglutathione lyase